MPRSIPPIEPTLEEGINLFAPEARPVISAAVQAAMERGIPYDLELPIITAKGNHRWVQTQGWAEIKDGKPIRIYGTFQDITDRKKASLALAKSEQRLALAFAGAGDGLWDWDLLTNEVYYSPQWESMFGFDPGTVAHTMETMTPRLHPDDAPGLFAEVNRYLNHEIPVYCHEARMFHKSGRILHTLHRATALFDEYGKAIRMLGTTVDITERKLAALELQDAIQRANSSALAKSEFLTSMSHEIRTPMNGVLGLTQLLEETQLNPEQRELVKTIQSSGNLLLTLLNDILDFSKMESGKFEIEALPVSLASILTDIHKSLLTALQAKGITFEIRISDQVPEVLLADPSRLRQIIFNLVGNAIKFTHEGGITVSTDWNGKELKLSVTDTGVGIPVEK